MGYDIGPKIGIDGEAEFRKAILNMNTTLKTLGSEMAVVASQFDKNDKSEKALTARSEVLNKQYDAQKERLAKLKDALEAARAKYGENDDVTQKWQQTVYRAEAQLNDLGRTLQQNEQDLESVRRGYDEAGQRLNEFGQTVEDTKKEASAWGEAFSKAGQMAGAAVAAAGTAMTAAMGTALAFSAKVGSDFEAGMSQVAATMGMTTEEIAGGGRAYEALEEAAKAAGAATKFSATESAQALNFLALAGYDAGMAAEALPVVLNLAAAGGMDLAYASDLATDAMAALGIEASKENLTRFGDEMARTSSKANTSVAQLGEAILTVGGTAKDLAGGTNELNAALGVLANRGVKGSEGGTALRNMILSLSAPTDKAAAQMEALGIQAFDAEGKLRPLNQVFGDFNAALSSLSGEDRTQILSGIFNKVDLKSVQGMLAGCGAEFDNLSVDIANSGGAMQNMADVQIDNLKGAVTILQSSLEGVGVAIYDGIREPMKEGVRSATDEITALSRSLSSGKLKPALEKLGDAFGKLISKSGQLAADALPRLIDAFVVVVDHGDEIAKALMGAVTAVTAFKAASALGGMITEFQKAGVAVAAYTAAQAAAGGTAAVTTGALTAQQVVVGLLTGKLTLAAAAQELWNIATAANPLGLLAVGVAAVIAGITAYSIATGDAKTESEELTDSIGELTDEARAYDDAQAELAARRDEAMSKSAAEINHLQSMADELENLTDATGKVKAGEEDRARLLANMINEIMPGTVEWIDEEGAAYARTMDSLDALIQKQTLKAWLDANQESYQAAIDNQQDLLANMADTNASLDKIQARIADLLEEQASFDPGSYEFYDIQSQILATEDLLAQGKDALRGFKDDYAQNTQLVTQYSSVQEALLSEDMDKIDAKLEEVSLNLSRYTGNNLAELEQQASDMAAQYDALLDLQRENGNAVTQEQLDAAKKRAAESKTIAEQAGREEVAARAAGMREAKGALEQATNEMVSTVTSRLSNVPREAAQSGAFTSEGFANGISSKTSLVALAAGNLANTAIWKLQQTIKQGSPSRVTLESGQWFDLGMAKGIDDKAKKVEDAAAKMSKNVLKAATDWVSEKKGYDQLTAAQEAEFWEEMKSIAGLGAKELREIDQKLYAARKNVSKEAFDYSKNWISNEKFYDRLSAEEEVEAWERVVNRKNLLGKEQAEAEKNLYTARKNLAKEQSDLLKKQADEEEKLYQKQVKAVEEYEKALESRTQSLERFAGLFDEIKRDTDVSGTELLKNLRGQVAAFQRWQADLEELMGRGVTGPLLEELQALGPKAADQLRALTTLSDRQLEEYINLFAEKGRLAAEQAQSEIAPVEIPLKVSEGKEGAEGTAADTMITFNTAIRESLQDVTTTGETVVHTLEEAIRGTGGSIVDAAKELISRFCYTFDSRYSSFKSTGLNAMAGLSAGLWAGGQEAIQTARDVADAIIAEMNRAMGIHSPSTVMAEMGGYMAQGLELGFARQMEDVRSNMARSMTPEAPALKAAEGTVNGILSGLAGMLPQAGGGTYIIKVVLSNDKELASVVFDPLQEIAKQRGVSLG